MFDGTSDQFPSTRTVFPLHLPFPLHPTTTPNINPFPPFSPYNPSRHLSSQQLPHNSLHPLHHRSTAQDDEQDKQYTAMVSMSLAVDSPRPAPELTQLLSDDTSWSNDEVLALLRIRSSRESWFSDLAWEHVSRKMLELGFKKSAQKCKDKFEEESRYVNANIDYNKNYRFTGELEELYEADHRQNLGCGTEKNPRLPEKLCDRQDKMIQSLEEDSGDDVVGKHYEGTITEQSAEKLKRKRLSVDHKFEMFKCFCENIVNKVMAHQEEMHKKLIEDMAKRDEEKIAREEAWKKQQMDKMHKELNIMAHEHTVAGDRQATIIEFLKKFAASSPETSNDNDHAQTPNNANPKTATTSSLMQQDTPISHSEQNYLGPQSSSISSPCQQSLCTSFGQNVLTMKPISSTEKLAEDNPNHPVSLTPRTCQELPSSSTANPYLHNNGQDTTLTTSSIPLKRGSSNPKFIEREDFGRRWPKDEVLALVNLRCSLNSSAAEDEEGVRAPLWERISQGMLELGYQRSSKQCKEKWENINKYFRKTRNVHKKRPLESRTCPYFHQLSALYSQGKLMVSRSEMAEDNNLMSSPAKQQLDQLHSHHVVSNITSHVIDEADDKHLIRVPPFDYDL